MVGDGGEANDEQNLSKHVCCGVEILINANSATTYLVMCNKFEDAQLLMVTTPTSRGTPIPLKKSSIGVF